MVFHAIVSKPVRDWHRLDLAAVGGLVTLVVDVCRRAVVCGGLVADRVMGRVDVAVRALTRRSRKRRSATAVHVSLPLYVRDEHGHAVAFEAAPQASVWWATVRALIALGDSREAEQCRLLHDGRLLHPRRSLQASGVGHGDTLELVTARVSPRRRWPLGRPKWGSGGERDHPARPR